MKVSMSQARALRLGTALTLVVSITGCASLETEPQEVATSETTRTVTQDPIADVITIWATEQIADSLVAVAEQFELDTGVFVEVVVKEFGTMRQEVADSTLSESTPDLFVGSHDWTGPLVQSGLISPLEVSDAYENFRPNALSAFAFENALYGIPFAVENIGLVCNSQLAPSEPKTWQELEAVGFEIAMSRSAGEPYHLYYLQSAFGAQIFERNADGSYLQELAMAGPEGVAFANWLSVNRDLFEFMDYSAVFEAMTSQELACWITGPWAWQDLSESLGEENLEVYDLPSPGEFKPSQFLDALGFFMSSSAKDPFYANKFFREYLASEAAQTDIYEITGRMPAHQKVIELAETNKKVSGFSRAGIDATPRPNISEMDYVWAPLGSAQGAILSGDANPEQVWLEMISAIQAQISVGG
jgi:arabinogalactan oligomer / maltooligosaccharide transport system substrate-binding protein